MSRAILGERRMGLSRRPARMEGVLPSKPDSPVLRRETRCFRVDRHQKKGFSPIVNVRRVVELRLIRMRYATEVGDTSAWTVPVVGHGVNGFMNEQDICCTHPLLLDGDVFILP